MTVFSAIAVPKAASRRCRSSATVSVSRATQCDACRFPLRCQNRATDGWNLTDCDLTARVIQKRLDVVEGRGQRCFLREYHQATDSAFVTCSG